MPDDPSPDPGGSDPTPVSDPVSPAAPPATVPALPAGSGVKYTQDQLDRIVAERVQKSKAQFRDYAELKAKVGELTERATQHQSLQQDHDSLKAEADGLKTQLLRFEVGLTKGLPVEAIKRLQGLTSEDIAKDADELLKVVRPATRPGGGTFNGGPQGAPDAKGPSMNDLIRERAGFAGS